MRPPIPLLAMLALLAGCDAGSRSAVSVDNAWIRLAAVAGQPAAGYATVKVADGPGALVGVSSPQAKRVEMHQTRQSGSMTGMEPLEAVQSSEIVFSPGGWHLMLFDVDPALKPGGRVDLIFRFEHGDPVTASARVVSAGEDMPHQAH